MTKRTSWEDVKAARADSSARRRGDERAGRAIRLAREIRALREKKGLSQRELAERVGTTQSAIARLEGGNISPSLRTLDRIADALGAELSMSIIVLPDRPVTSRDAISEPSALVGGEDCLGAS